MRTFKVEPLCKDTSVGPSYIVPSMYVEKCSKLLPEVMRPLFLKGGCARGTPLYITMLCYSMYAAVYALYVYNIVCMCTDLQDNTIPYHTIPY